MKVIPVIDVLNGVVVHAVKGERKHYRPLKSIVSVSPDPLNVANAFRGMGFGELYLADLNAIMGLGNNFDMIRRIAKETKLRLMVDAGVADIEKAKILLHHNASSVIIGTETMTRMSFVEEAVCSLGTERVMVSLDLRAGQLLAKFSLSESTDALAVLHEFQKMGIKQVIVLDLARVGSQEGVDVVFLREVVKSFRVGVFVGGGVRSMDDLLELDDIGVAGVLLATALHSGKITAEQIVAKGFAMR